MKYKNLLKFVLFSFYAVVISLVIYITYDCIRLKNSEFGVKPLIVFHENSLEIKDNIKESYNEYKGLLYTIKYSYFYDEENNQIIKTGKGREFKLFGKVLIWADIE